MFTSTELLNIFHIMFCSLTELTKLTNTVVKVIGVTSTNMMYSVSFAYDEQSEWIT
jgi:hypothetical protein